MIRRDDATEAQVRAAEPLASTWLSANAGSGKTRVLTDRVARLLLKEVLPERILCLTYTKAAASEMQNRLFKRLGAWAMLADKKLAEELETLGVPADENTPEARKRARTLFARAIETPGGLKIQTIHSFCATLLRRFPLEAGVSPRFTEMDDRAAALLREEVLEEMASDGRVGAIDTMATFLSGDDPTALLAGIVARADILLQPLDEGAFLRCCGLDANDSVERLLADVLTGEEEDLVTAIAPALEAGKVSDQGLLKKLRAIVARPPSLAVLRELEGCFLTGETAKEPFTVKTGSTPTKDTRTALGPLLEPLHDWFERVAAGRPRRMALMSLQRARALHRLANLFLPDYSARKQQRGWLDFDDLILGARRLLTDPAVADWVLFKLDGGIDHILVDEAQDTSPAQWDVITMLAREFTSGQGARHEAERSIFVVGDKKQSIYSFQGADPAAFDRLKLHFRDALGAIQQPLQEESLLYSFRSAEPILRLVDLAFRDGDANGLGGETLHRAFKSDLPGRVDLWPVVEKTEEADKPAWTDPVDKPASNHHEVVLARRIARRIKAMIGTPMPDEKGGARPIRPGDFLVLVQRRSDLFHEIFRACKAEGLPMAGADRLKVGGELAVKDLSALLSFLATNEDSLSLAAALRSPLLGWSERQLYDLAHNRPLAEKYLWTTLRRRQDEFPETMEILRDLLRNADFLRPYELIERILTRHGGRERLIAQLGTEAEDGIDALLGQTLAYETLDIPSLTGFLGWLSAGELDIKRQLDNAGDRIRVMSVHGAKGLEAPIVILPDAAVRKVQIRDEVILMEDRDGRDLPLWRQARPDCPEAIIDVLSDMERSVEEERLRLLYVAMTRAEQWLIVTAAGDVGEGQQSWYGRVAEAMETAGATPLALGEGEGEAPEDDPFDILRLETGDWSGHRARIEAPGAADPTQTETAPAGLPLPDWIKQHAATPARPLRPLTPSELGGAKSLPGEGTWPHDPAGADGPMDTETALRKGRMIHLLLELLPGMDAARWPQAAAAILSGSSDQARPDEIPALLEEAAAVLSAPALHPVFAPDALAEVPFTAPLPALGGRPVYGIMDRVILSPDAVRIVDFKTNAVVPASAQEVPLGLLRQMGAYCQAAEQIFPGRRVDCAILWTRDATLMPLPTDLVIAALAERAPLDPLAGDT